MMVMTAKVDKKKIIIALLGALALLGAILLLAGGDSEPTAASLASNDGRVAFLQSLGYEVTTSPVTSGQVRIPETSDQVFEKYNELQKSAGYDLTQYAGKLVMRYVYKVNNYQNATEPVYATLLVYKDAVIGGDVTDTAPQGQIRPLVAYTPQDTVTNPTEDNSTTPSTG